MKSAQLKGSDCWAVLFWSSEEIVLFQYTKNKHIFKWTSFNLNGYIPVSFCRSVVGRLFVNVSVLDRRLESTTH